MARRGVGSAALLASLAITACTGGGMANPPDASAAAPVGAPSATGSSVWAGVYTQSQARRGAAEYSTACSSCHSANLRGNSNSPSLVGGGFMFLWENRSVGDLFTAIRTQMPTNAPNSLTADAYLDILAYIMEVNGFPAGERPLVEDADLLGGLLITANRDDTRP